MEYATSIAELRRRKQAFVTFVASLMVGWFASSCVFHVHVSPLAYLVVALVVALLTAILFRSFTFLAQAKLTLTTNAVVRFNRSGTESIPIADIESVRIKWTTKHTIREFLIRHSSGKQIAIHALEDPEAFKNDLVSKLGKDVRVHELHEPIDFDHPLFYAILGIPVSFAGVLLFKLIANFDGRNAMYYFFAIALYCLGIGIYFLSTKPIAARYGNQKRTADIIFGSVLVCAGVICAIFGFA